MEQDGEQRRVHENLEDNYRGAEAEAEAAVAEIAVEEGMTVAADTTAEVYDEAATVDAPVGDIPAPHRGGLSEAGIEKQQSEQCESRDDRRSLKQL